jgi:membrane fusion protein, heavy metal efflux system
MTEQPSTPLNCRRTLRKQFLFPLLAAIVALTTVSFAVLRWRESQQAANAALKSTNPQQTVQRLVSHDVGQQETAELGLPTPNFASERQLTLVELPEEQWENARIQLQETASSPFTKTIRLTGKIELNQDRIAHIYSMVEGAVDRVSVTLGQQVKENDLLAVIHSREVGAAKLQLYQARLQLELAQTKDRLQSEIAMNSRELIQALREDKPIREIEQMFRNRPMGDFRERVLATYSSYLKSAADVTRLKSIVESGAVSGNQLLTAEANRNADLATFQSRIEQIEYELGTSVLLSSQAVKEAEAMVLVASTSLTILGCDAEEISQINPAQQGELLSHYSIRAPFDGTVLTKDVVLREQVRSDVMLLSIADLSTVWVNANIYEEHLPLLNSMTDRTITIRNKAFPNRTFTASVFYTGEVMEEASRTITLRAVADNKDHLLKPGMFITVELTGAAEEEFIQVPTSAVQEHEGIKFVFVHRTGDQFERRDLKLGEANDTAIVVREGLTAGESVVVEGAFILKSAMLADLMGEE